MGYFIGMDSKHNIALGLGIISIIAVGNCFFRDIAYQVEGYEEQYTKYLEMVVQYIMEHHEIFDHFAKDNVNFDEHYKLMKQSGPWDRHMH